MRGMLEDDDAAASFSLSRVSEVRGRGMVSDLRMVLATEGLLTRT